MKIPKIHLNKKQSKIAVIILTSLAAISVIVQFTQLSYTTPLGILLKTISLVAVALFGLFQFKLNKQSQKPHQVFAAILFVFGSYFSIVSVSDAISVINHIHNVSYFNIYTTYSLIGLFCYISVAFLSMVSAIAVYKKEDKTRIQKIALPAIALLTILIFLNETFRFYGYLFNMLYVMIYPCLAIALNIYYNHNPLIPNAPIDLKKHTLVEALRILKEQFSSGIIDEETYARLRSEALKKL